MANTDKISSIFKDIRKKVQAHVYIPPSVTKKNSVSQSDKTETITITKK